MSRSRSSSTRLPTSSSNLDTAPLAASRCGQLGDRMETLADLPFLGAERFGERPAQRLKRDGVWQDLTYAELRDIAREVGLGLVAFGVRPGDRVCVLSETRPEWVQAELGIAAAGAVVVPIYPSSGSLAAHRAAVPPGPCGAPVGPVPVRLPAAGLAARRAAVAPSVPSQSRMRPATASGTSSCGTCPTSERTSKRQSGLRAAASYAD